MSSTTVIDTPAARTRNPIGFSAAALRRRAVYLLAAGSVALAACGGADASVDTPAAAPAPVAAAPTTQAPTTLPPTTLPPTTLPPTTQAPLAGGLPANLQSIQPGDCVAGSGFGEELHEAPCPAEGTVLSVVADSDATCTSGNQTISGSSISTDGDRSEYTLCVETGATGATGATGTVTPVGTGTGLSTVRGLFGLDGSCSLAIPGQGQVSSVRCDEPDVTRYFVQLAEGHDAYVGGFATPLTQVGTWGSNGTDCGADYFGTTSDGHSVLVSTFTSSPYAVIAYSSSLGQAELVDGSTWSFDSSMC